MAEDHKAASMRMEVRAPAKINLYLDVLKKRSDGYHDLLSLMVCIGIHDTVRFSFMEPGIGVSCNHPDVPDDSRNLAYKAAHAFFNASGLPPAATMTIDKQIPVGAGLGGGSSDAATVLTSLNKYHGNPLSTEELMALGKSLGADVPFFISARPSVATGIGERLAAISGIPEWPLVLIYPGQPVSTGQVYEKLNLALTKTKKINTKSIFELGWESDAPKHLFNVLEPVAMKLCPKIGVAKTALLNAGAAGALMSGSGSSVFGLFKDVQGADRAFQELSGNCDWQVFQTQLLT